MVFTSLEFLTLFLPAVLLLYISVPEAGRNLVLLCGSSFFLGWLSPTFMLLHTVLTLFTWGGGLLIDRLAVASKARSRVLAGLIVVNILVLCWYKYTNILVASFSGMLLPVGALPLEWEKIALPAGLSFIVLQAISYLVDVHRRTVAVERSFVDYATFLLMFGQSIAGPIILYSWVSEELSHRGLSWANFCLGARRFMVGMSMKVLVADSLSPLVDAAFVLQNPSFIDAWIGCLAYSLQLFFDFAGYSAMAIGIGLMLGFHFPENFNQPYLARSIQDFWRRWHLSLSSWLRDYLYIPLGGNRGSQWLIYRNLFLTMAIAGLWHGGDSWNFLLWGSAHGVALCVARIWEQAGWIKFPRVLSHVLTLLFVALAWTLFRAPDFATALNMYAGQFGLYGFSLGDGLRVTLRPAHGMAALLGVVCIIAPIYQSRCAARFGQNTLFVTLASLWPVLGFLLSFALIASRETVPFLYFQF
jgi:alginate O-acetyltransferase complex protein AlgI